MSYPLEPTPAQMREMGAAAIESVVGFVEGLEDHAADPLGDAAGAVP